MIHTNDGQTLKATKADDIVAELNAISFAPQPSPRQFMRSSAERIKTFFGRKIRTNCAENYVADLFEFGFLSTDEEPKHRQYGE